MIVFLLAIVCLAGAKPTQQPGAYVVDGVEGVLYEFAEYADPELALFRLSAMGAMPVLTVLEMGSVDFEDNLGKEQDATHFEGLDDVKRGLEDVIVRLQLAKSKLEKGSTNILIDIKRSLNNLMKLEHNLRTSVNPVSISIQDVLKSIRDDNDSTTGAEMPSTQTPIVTESPKTDHEKKNKEKSFGDGFFIAQTNKFQEPGKAVIHEKLTMASSSIV